MFRHGSTIAPRHTRGRAIDPDEQAADVKASAANRRSNHVTFDARVRVGSEESHVIRWLMTDGRSMMDGQSLSPKLRHVPRIATGVRVLHPLRALRLPGRRRGRARFRQTSRPRRESPDESLVRLLRDKCQAVIDAFLSRVGRNPGVVSSLRK
jgi:hypothetical protein